MISHSVFIFADEIIVRTLNANGPTLAVKVNVRANEKNRGLDNVGWMRLEKTRFPAAHVDLHRSASTVIVRLSTGVPLTPRETRERNCGWIARRLRRLRSQGVLGIVLGHKSLWGWGR